MGYFYRTEPPLSWDEEYAERDDPVYCRDCGGYLGQADTITDENVIYFNGWWFCRDHGEALIAMAHAQPKERP